MKKTVLFFIISLFVSFSIFSQSSDSDYIHEYLSKESSCKSGAITDTYGYVILSGRKYAAWSGIPRSLAEYLQNELNAGRVIDDICLTEKGSWYCVGDKLYGEGCPQSMHDEISEYLKKGDRINCVTFNDYGEWMVITDNHFSASDDYILDIMKEVSKKYGFIHAASMNNQGLIIVGNDGFQSKGNIPDSLDKYLRYDQSFDIKYIKFTENGSWLVTDGYSKYAYSLY